MTDLMVKFVFYIFILILGNTIASIVEDFIKPKIVAGNSKIVTIIKLLIIVLILGLSLFFNKDLTVDQYPEQKVMEVMLSNINDYAILNSKVLEIHVGKKKFENVKTIIEENKKKDRYKKQEMDYTNSKADNQ